LNNESNWPKIAVFYSLPLNIIFVTAISFNYHEKQIDRSNNLTALIFPTIPACDGIAIGPKLSITRVHLGTKANAR